MHRVIRSFISSESAGKAAANYNLKTMRRKSTPQDDLFGLWASPLPQGQDQCAKARPSRIQYVRYARVAVDEPVDGLFDYGVPLPLVEQICVGSIVEVRFGPKTTCGCVVELSSSHSPEISPNRILPVKRILTPEYRISPDLLELGKWMSDYYFSPLGQTLRCISFFGFNHFAPEIQVAYSLTRLPGSPSGKFTEKQLKVLRLLETSHFPLSAKEILRATGVSASVLDALLRKGLVQKVLTEKREVSAANLIPVELEAPLPLNADQNRALAAVRRAMDEQLSSAFVLHGVTGSGKTEVYLQAIQHALDLGKEAIVLVPEISLTPQTLQRFSRRFGNTVGVYHSKLSSREKYELWRRIESRECRVLVGARSALFAPFENLGIIVVDEEHETTYKQDSAPRYHARDVAVVRAKMCKCPVILGSATPSMESYFNCQTGKYELLELPHRVEERPLPEVHIVDMTREVAEGDNPALFSATLVEAMRQTLESGQQVLVFLNRRGYFNFAICLACQNVIRCEHCDVALTYHKVGNRMLCHYCNFQQPRPTVCPQCGAPEIAMLGLGTQRVEEELTRLFPQARVLRFDLDTMKSKYAYPKAWQQIVNNEVQIILGTQMIAKGLHLVNVALVAVPLADVSLFQPDFRAAERAFSILTQVAGRTGRSSIPGRVIIQTYVPHHYAIQYAQSQDYRGFYEKEIRVRKVLRFPPHQRLIAILGLGKDSERTRELFHEFSRIVENTAHPHSDEVSVLGPTPAPRARLEGQFRWRLLLRSANTSLMRSVLRRALERWEKTPRHSHITLTVDVDPLDLL
ncbi:MAG: primosomal protein N' [Candidatus Hydrogenedentota bacterium]|jgi:primosomal protein N' (replication factor Y)|nr:MAG: primosomal protein N' [Candidatus Hydrogenedentota bacterium]GIX44491.1 MAG: hypothetical protein KatS3mg130_0899 [Candidatus Sumerlaea sp.]